MKSSAFNKVIKRKITTHACLLSPPLLFPAPGVAGKKVLKGQCCCPTRTRAHRSAKRQDASVCHIGILGQASNFATVQPTRKFMITKTAQFPGTKTREYTPKNNEQDSSMLEFRDSAAYTKIRECENDAVSEREKQ